jgi:ketosteroid isomerase-like protein
VSRENVEAVRRANEAFSRGDSAAMREWLDPECEWWGRVDDLGPEVVRGHDAIEERFAEMDELAKSHIALGECIDAGEFVVVAVRVVGRGQASGATFEARRAIAYRLRDGRITEVRPYGTMREALQGVGLEE